MYRSLILLLLFGVQSIQSVAQSTINQKGHPTSSKRSPSVVKIREVGHHFELIRDGEPYFIKGANGTTYLDKLVETGGNSIRPWKSSIALMDKAQKIGLTVCINLQMKKPRLGADYRDTNMLKEQRDQIFKQVMDAKNHPAVLMWAIGNEVELNASPEESVLVWKETETIAKMIKEIDQNHPVITVVAGAGKKLTDLKHLCPSLDAIGINSYGELLHVPSLIQKYGWKKPYIVTEFGPQGWWEVPKTAWGVPVENTSTGKSHFYYKAYQVGIGDQSNCLGSYVFFWGNRQEKTNTWFNMFLQDGHSVEMMDTMMYLWTGKWPANRAPSIGNKGIYVIDSSCCGKEIL